MNDDLPDPSTIRTEPPPIGCHFEWMPEPMFGCMAWRLVGADEVKRCARKEAGGRCTNQAVAKLQRGRVHLGVKEQWWPYCADHMYGRRISGRRVWAIHVLPNATESV